MKWMSIAFLLILAVALGLRLPHLADRPMHHDEANQAYRFGILLEEGTYQYDANDHHGPTLYYLTLPIAQLTGAETFAETTETTYRIVPVIFGILLILCIPLLHSGMGGIAILAVAFFAAISPAMAYYSRFYIQESLLLFFTFLAIATGWLALCNRSTLWTVVCGLSLGLMFATKETAIISYAAMTGSVLLCLLFRRSDVPVAPVRPATRTSLLRLSSVAAGSATVIAFVLFSSFFSNLNGPLQSILAIKGYLVRGSGADTGHVHPWNFYLAMLLRPEGLAFGLGWVGIGSILWKKLPKNCDQNLAHFLMFYTLLLTLAYSVLPYKTPWCILSFLHGWILLAGIGVAALFGAVRRKMPRLLLAILLAISATLTAKQAHRLVFRQVSDPRNPYAYVQTSHDFKNLLRRIDELKAVSPKGKEMYIQVIAPPDSTWPLPFYLRQFPNIGYWTNAVAIPPQPRPDLIISTPQLQIDPEKYLVEFYGLRPDTPLALHIDSNLWNTFLETRK